MFPPLPAPLRATIAVLSRTAPRTGGKALFELFCRPPRVRLRTAEQRAIVARDQERFERATEHRATFAHGIIVWRTFAAPRDDALGTVALLHGFGSHGVFMAAFVNPLLDAGFDVVVPDLPGHGKSSGRRVHVAMAVDALLAMQAATGPWTALVAHSFGGAVATAAVAGTIEGRTPLRLTRLVLIGVPESVPEIFDTFADWCGAGAGARRAMRARVPLLSGHPVEDFRGHLQLRQAGIPTLALHATDDKEIAFSNADALSRAGTHVEVLPIPGAGHRRILRDETAIAATRDFIAAATPSHRPSLA